MKLRPILANKSRSGNDREGVRGLVGCGVVGKGPGKGEAEGGSGAWGESNGLPSVLSLFYFLYLFLFYFPFYYDEFTGFIVK